MVIQEDLFIEGQKYIIDTSSLIILRESYPEDLFGPLHEKLLTVFVSGKIVILDMVMDELKDKEKPLYDYLKINVPKSRHFTYVDYLLETQRIIHTYYDGTGKAHKLKADPHIISCAKGNDLTIITEELNSAVTKIPFVGSKEGVQSMNLVGFMRAENIKE